MGGNETMGNVASILGLEAVKKEPRVAYIRCNGTCDHRPKTSNFDGAGTCAIASSVYSGESDCQYGCLGYGDCVDACDFDAIDLREGMGVPLILDDKCVACGACVDACPKNLIEMRKKFPKDRKIVVACRNEDKGGVARKACSVWPVSVAVNVKKNVSSMPLPLKTTWHLLIPINVNCVGNVFLFVRQIQSLN